MKGVSLPPLPPLQDNWWDAHFILPKLRRRASIESLHEKEDLISVPPSSRSWRSDRQSRHPSMDTTVVRSPPSVMVCRMWATHSHPALVVKAYWKGAVAFSAFLATCFATVLTPPSGFLSAVKRPNPDQPPLHLPTPLSLLTTSQVAPLMLLVLHSYAVRRTPSPSC